MIGQLEDRSDEQVRFRKIVAAGIGQPSWVVALAIREGWCVERAREEFAKLRAAGRRPILPDDDADDTATRTARRLRNARMTTRGTKNAMQ